jgi:hypothetical protein
MNYLLSGFARRRSRPTLLSHFLKQWRGHLLTLINIARGSVKQCEVDHTAADESFGAAEMDPTTDYWQGALLLAPTARRSGTVLCKGICRSASVGRVTRIRLQKLACGAISKENGVVRDACALGGPLHNAVFQSEIVQDNSRSRPNSLLELVNHLFCLSRGQSRSPRFAPECSKHVSTPDTEDVGAKCRRPSCFGFRNALSANAAIRFAQSFNDLVYSPNRR